MFNEINFDNLSQWVCLVKKSYNGVKASLRKHAFLPSAIQCAIRMQNAKTAISDAAINMDTLEPSIDSTLACQLCGDRCDSVTALTMHLVSKHKLKDPVHTCVNTVWCPVCGILYSNRGLLMEHCAYRSKVCRMNLLLRGAFFPWDEISALESQQSDICAANVKAGRPRYFASTPAVRIFGPHLPIFDASGQLIVPSKGGHPLGNGLAVYRPAQCDLPLRNSKAVSATLLFVARAPMFAYYVKAPT